MLKIFIQLLYYIRRVKKYEFVQHDEKIITEETQKIWINSVKTNPVSLFVELFFANYYAMRGHQVILTVDDGMLAHHDTFQYVQKRKILNPSRAISIKAFLYILQFLINNIFTNIQIIRISSLLGNAKKKYQNDFLESDWEDEINASTDRYFQLFPPSPKVLNEYKEKSALNCNISYVIAKYIYHDMGFKRLLTSHAIYSLWSPAYKVYKSAGDTRILVYGTNTYKSGELSFSNTPLQVQSATKEFQQFLNRPVSNEEKITKYFDQRIDMKAKDTAVYYNYELRQFSVNHEYFNILVCPNVAWDGNINERNICFDGLIDWINWYVKYAKRNVNCKLYIRFHPGEFAWYKDCISLEQALHHLNVSLDHDRIEVISSSQPFDMYGTVREFDAVVVYDGILALESTYMGVPLILNASGRYAASGLGHMPRSKEELESILDKAINKTEPLKVGKRSVAIAVCDYYMNYTSANLSIINNDRSDYGVNLSKIKMIDFENNKPLSKWLDRLI